MVYKCIADILAFITVQVPQYLFVLKLSVHVKADDTACGVVTILRFFAGRPMDFFLISPIDFRV